MNIKELKKIFSNGSEITFEITNHKRIPNVVKLDNSIIGTASISTINAFNKWKNSLKSPYLIDIIDLSGENILNKE